MQKDFMHNWLGLMKKKWKQKYCSTNFAYHHPVFTIPSKHSDHNFLVAQLVVYIQWTGPLTNITPFSIFAKIISLFALTSPSKKNTSLFAHRENCHAYAGSPFNQSHIHMLSDEKKKCSPFVVAHLGDFSSVQILR